MEERKERGKSSPGSVGGHFARDILTLSRTCVGDTRAESKNRSCLHRPTRRVVPGPESPPRAHQKFRGGGINVLKELSAARALFAASCRDCLQNGSPPGRIFGRTRTVFHVIRTIALRSLFREMRGWNTRFSCVTHVYFFFFHRARRLSSLVKFIQGEWGECARPLEERGKDRRALNNI